MNHPTLRRQLLLAGLAALPGLAFAQTDLARANGCLVCHAVEKKVIGPAWRDVALRYAGQQRATDALATSILHGSVGRWGTAPMPPNPGVSETDARQLARWVLSLPPP